ncbi:phosphogluconate dehydrogenase (NAD(+)-dependent, decarboxylating) [Candidatus Dependentiae bacterium]
MKLGIIGLGRMGNAIAYRAINGGFKVAGFDIDKEALAKAEEIGVETVDDIADLAERADVIWLMVPVGDLVDAIIEKLMPHLSSGDIIVDGGNSNYKDSIKRAEKLKAHGIYFLDCGTSGGLHGREVGFSLMVGGEKKAYSKIIPLLEAIAAKDGFGYMGRSGAGHYVKMIHNGIEYGLLQAYAEGFQLLKEGKYENLDLEKISKVWMHGSVIRSFILELVHEIYQEKIDFSKIVGEIQEGGTGKWTVKEAKEQNVSVPVIEKSLEIRAWSRESAQQAGGNYATKLVALLRNKFGGHKVKKIKQKN